VCIVCQCTPANCDAHTHSVVLNAYALSITMPIEFCIIYQECKFHPHQITYFVTSIVCYSLQISVFLQLCNTYVWRWLNAEVAAAYFSVRSSWVLTVKLGSHVNLVTRRNEAAAAVAPFARSHCTQAKRVAHEWRLLLPGQCHPAGVQPLELLQAFSMAT